jgi:hypothetical protein
VFYANELTTSELGTVWAVTKNNERGVTVGSGIGGCGSGAGSYGTFSRGEGETYENVIGEVEQECVTIVGDGGGGSFVCGVGFSSSLEGVESVGEVGKGSQGN